MTTIIKSFFLITMLFFSVSILANPNAVINLSAKYDENNRLVNPDAFFLRKALVTYQNNNYDYAFSNFMKSAAFGNTDAQMYIGLMYLKALGVTRNWAKGYAWLQLAAQDKTKKHTDLARSVKLQLTPEELVSAQTELIEINKDYEASITLKRRYRWVRKQKLKVTGSHTGSQAMIGRLQTQKLNGTVDNGNSVSAMDQMDNFVNNFNFGYVSGGEITPKEEGEEL